MSVAVPSYYIWMVFLLPYAGALITPLLAKLPKVRDYASVLISFVSALFAFLLILPVLRDQSVTVFDSCNVLRGIDDVVRVDVFIPSCPRGAEAFIQGCMLLQEKIRRSNSISGR